MEDSKLTQKEMRGCLFKNKKKTESKQPDYSGNCLIDGKRYWVAGWVEDYGNEKRLAIQFTTIEEKEL